MYSFITQVTLEIFHNISGIMNKELCKLRSISNGTSVRNFVLKAHAYTAYVAFLNTKLYLCIKIDLSLKIHAASAGSFTLSIFCLFCLFYSQYFTL